MDGEEEEVMLKFREFRGKIAGDTSKNIVLCKPAQSKCTWTFHKTNFVWKFTGEMPYATAGDTIPPRMNTGP